MNSGSFKDILFDQIWDLHGHICFFNTTGISFKNISNSFFHNTDFKLKKISCMLTKNHNL